jgi:hypothetical protein
MAGLAALAAALLLYSPSTFAWGGLGHEAICELAFLELNDTARQRVIALIRQDQEFPTFRASYNWADRPRQHASEHFVNLPRDSTGLDDDECPLADECVVSAIKHDFTVSHRPTQPTRKSWRRLGSWATGSATSTSPCTRHPRATGAAITYVRGGSSCESLHTLWDSCIVEERLGMHPLAIVREIRAGITDEQRAAWLAGDVIAWANESFAIARKPDVGYWVVVGDTLPARGRQR